MASPTSPNHFLSSLPARDLAALQPYLKPVELRGGEFLSHADEPVTGVYFPHSGIVSTVIGFSGGQFVEAGLTGRNSVVGPGAPLNGEVALNDATVQVAGSGVMAEASRVKQLALRRVKLRASFARHEEMQLAQVQRVAACNAIHSLEERLCRWLMQAYDLHDGNTLPFTQELLSQMLGVQRSSVSTVAGRLQAAGLIAYHRGDIEIIDVAALKNACCECYQIINAQYRRLIGWTPPR